MAEPAFIGIDLGGTFIKAVALGEDGAVLGTRRAPTARPAGYAPVLDQIVSLIELLRDDVSAANRAFRWSGIGLAVPGVIDAAAGRVEFTVALAPEWNGFAAAAALEARLGMPTVLLNDAQAATVGEQLQGGGRPYRHFVCITIGTGIGGGLVLEGRLYSGSRGMSGVLGHTTVVPDGPRCACGNRGCLEMVASGTAIARAATQFRLPAEAPRARRTRITPREVAAAARAGDADARRVFEVAGAYIGIALGNLVCILNPEAIVVGGGVSSVGELLLDPIRREIGWRTTVFSRERGGIDVIQSPLGSDAGAIGSACWAAQGAGAQ